jgi:diguanylate cyclase (GGDEF)-like protein
MVLALLLTLAPAIESHAQPAASSDAAGGRVTDVVAECFTIRRSQPARAVQIVDQALAGASPSGPERVKLLACKGMAMALSGDATGAMRTVDDIEAFLKAEPQPPGFMLRAFSNAGATAHLAGDIPRALDLYLRAFEAARSEDAADAQVSTLVNIGALYSEELGAYDEAEGYFAQADAIHARARPSDALLPYNRAMNHLRAGRPALADQAFEQARGLAAQHDMDIVVLRADAERLALRAQHEHVAGVEQRLAALARQQQGHQDPGGASTTLVRASTLALTRGDATAALDFARQAEELASRGGFLTEQRDAQQGRIAALIRLNRFEEAMALSQQLADQRIHRLQQYNLRGIADLQARLQDGFATRELGRVRDAQRINDLREANIRQGRIWLAVGLVMLALIGLAASVYQRVLNRRLQQLSTTDALTGLLNRRAAAGKIQALASAHEGTVQRRHVILLIDIDHFKQLNDRAGHAAGDLVLVEVARRLGTCCRPDDVVARWGGEEFLIVLPATRGLDPLELAERLRARVEALQVADRHQPPIPVTLSVGIATLAAGESGAGWLKRADEALYRAKDAGRNCCRVAEPPEH